MINPISEKTTTSSFIKSVELLKGNLSLVKVAEHIFFLIILGIVSVVQFSFPFFAVLILLLGEIFSTLLGGYFRVKELNAISQIQTNQNATSYRKILITSQHWEFIRSTLGLIVSAISIILVFVFFNEQLSNINSFLPIDPSILKYALSGFVIFRLFNFIFRFVSYQWIKKIKASNNFAEVDRDYLQIQKKLGLIKFIPFMSLLLLFVFLIGIPYWIPLAFAGFMILLVFISLIELKRLEQVEFSSDKIDRSHIDHVINSYSNEQVAGAVFGIMKTATSFFDIFKPTSTSFFGVGKSKIPENTLVLTNYRLMMVQVPLAGGDKMIGKTDYVNQNFLLNRSELKQKGTELIQSNMSKIIDFTRTDVLYNDIKKVTLKNRKIIIEKNSGEKLGYFYIDAEYDDVLIRVLKFYLKDKFII